MPSTLKTNAIEPEGATTTMSVGNTGKNVIITDNLKANVLKDSGDGYNYAAFTLTGADTWTCPTGVTSAEILVVAGGGGGSAPYYAGGGGAGGVVHAAAYPVTAGTVYDLTVGAKGDNGNATAGGNSVFNVNGEGSNTTVLTANGGGRGGGGGGPAGGGAGGSGGGTDNDASSGGASNQPASFGSPQIATGYGNAGGAVGGNSGSGGGGASAAGGGSWNNPALGGAGGAGKLFSNFTAYGTTFANTASTGSDGGYFAGGGGGGSYNNLNPGGVAGVGGGGLGGGTDSPSNQGTNGLPNTGGGGGGGDTNGSGKDGGSGIVIIRYLSGAPNAIFTSNGSGVLTGVNAGFGSAWVLLSTTTVSSAVANVSITANIDSTYKHYVVEMVNVVPATDNVNFQFQFGSGGGPSYGLSKTTTNFAAYHNQDNSTATLGNVGTQLANSTNPQILSWGNTPNNTACLAGWLHLFDPASTTLVKNFYVRTQQKSTNPRSQDQWGAGYANTTTAITAIQFTMTSGNITEGTFKLYGIR